MDPVKRIVKCFGKISKHHTAIAGGMEKCVGMTKAAKAGKPLDLDQLNGLLEQMLERHSAIGDECESCVEDCEKEFAEAAEKAANDRLNKRVGIQKPPEGFSAINPGRAVPRDGQPPISQPAAQLAKSEPVLARIAGTSETDQHAPEASLE